MIILAAQAENEGRASLKDVAEKLKEDERYEYLIKYKSSLARLSSEGDITEENITEISLDDIEEIYVTHKGCEVKIDNELNVKAVGELKEGTIITYTTEPATYTNADSIKLSLKISNSKGIRTIKFPDGGVVECNGMKEYAKDYPAMVNGTYNFIVTDVEGNEETKTIVIDLIDKLEPKDFTPEVQRDGGTITITPNGDDAEADETSSKSGIAYYEYYVINEKNEETKYKTNVIENLELGTYQIYVIAYDKAGNSKKSSTVEVKISVQFEKIVGGSGHYIAIDKEGNLWSWGRNDVGQLGNGNSNGTSVLKPTKIEDRIKFKEISASERSSIAIDTEGKLWVWGDNSSGQLGLGSSTKFINKLKSVNEDIKFDKIVAFGYDYCFVEDTQGNIYGTGDSGYGELGNGNLGYQYEFVLIKQIKNFEQISAGNYTTLTIDNQGKLWAWGNNAKGQFGNGKKENTQISEPIEVESEQFFKQISVGYDHCLAIDSNNKLWTWGNNSSGQLGNESNEESLVPIQIKSDTEFKEIYAGKMYSMAIDKDGKLWTWGADSGRVLGKEGAQKASNIPINIKSDVNFKKIIGSDYFTGMAIDIDDNIWVWGNNLYGQYGNGTYTSSDTPIQLH